MARFIEGQDRQQVTFLPECLDDFNAEDNPKRVVDVFVAELNLSALGFDGSTPAATCLLSYHPAAVLKIYIYGYLNRVQSSRHLKRERQRNVELMWLGWLFWPKYALGENVLAWRCVRGGSDPPLAPCE
jgi:transposase